MKLIFIFGDLTRFLYRVREEPFPGAVKAKVDGKRFSPKEITRLVKKL